MQLRMFIAKGIDPTALRLGVWRLFAKLSASALFIAKTIQNSSFETLRKRF